MKKIFIIISVLLIPMVFFFGCEDRTDLTAPTPQSPKSGDVDFSRFVVIGNSLAAGFQSGSLYEEAQMHSFGKLIADKMNVPFAQPYFSDPGTPGRITVVSLSPFVTNISTQSGTPTNLAYKYPYNNLGVPGARLYDVLNATNQNDCFTGLAGAPNPLFDVILRNAGTQFQQARLLQPSFVILWIGSNDVLGFATSGGVKPDVPTDINLFKSLFAQTADSIASLGAKVAVGNIPDVTAIPFFTTVGPQIAAALQKLGAPGIVYQKHGGIPAQADVASLANGTVLVTLTGSGYASLLGQPTGKFYRDNGYPALPPGIDTTKAFGGDPANPWPDALILDASEIETAKNTTNEYNQNIDAVAASKGFAVADIHSLLNNLRAADASGGLVFNGVPFKSTFVEGGVFGLDGVHPTYQGQGIIANEFIKAINSKFSSNFPLIDVSLIPGSLMFTSKSSGKIIPNFPPHAFDHLFF